MHKTPNCKTISGTTIYPRRFLRDLREDPVEAKKDADDGIDEEDEADEGEDALRRIWANGMHVIMWDAPPSQRSPGEQIAKNMTKPVADEGFVGGLHRRKLRKMMCDGAVGENSGGPFCRFRQRRKIMGSKAVASRLSTKHFD